MNRVRRISTCMVIVILAISFASALIPFKVYTHTAESPFTVPLAMGNTNIPVGFVKVWNDDTNLYVVFEIDNESYPEYAMSETHLEVSKTPLSWSPPGLWTYSHTYSPYAFSDVYTVPFSSIDGGASPGDNIWLMAHASICDHRYECVHVGSAYGSYFKGSFNYTIQTEAPAEPQLSIVKTGPLTGYPGGTYIYTVIVSNIGSVPAYDVNVTDILPSGVTPAYPDSPGSPTGVYDAVKNVVNWSFGVLGVGDIVVITLEVKFDESLTPGSTLTDRVEAVWEDEGGASYGPVESEWETSVIAGPKLTVEKKGPIKGYPDGIIVYTVIVSNVGNATAYSVQVQDTLSPWVEYVSSTPAGSMVGGKIVWDLGSLNNGSTILLTLTVRIKDGTPNGTQVIDSVEVRWKDIYGNGYGPETDEWVTTVFSNPLLSIAKVGPTDIYPGQEIEYSISVKNLGGSTAYSVNVTDKLPEDVTYISSNPEGVYDTGSNTVNWTVEEIAPGETVILRATIVFTPSPPECVTLIDNATVVWKDILDRLYGPVWDTEITRVCSPPLLRVDKTGDSKGKLGETLSFSINVTNLGSSGATNVRIIDDLPSGLEFISSTPPYTSYNHSTGRIVWDAGSIEAGESIRIDVTVEVSTVEYDGIILFNNVYVNWTDIHENRYGPITDVHPIQLFIDPYVEVSKDAPLQLYAGSTFTYTIYVVNPTQTQLSGVTLKDYLPSSTSYISSNPPGTYDGNTHSVTWSGITLNQGETKIFTVEVSSDPNLPEGTIIIDEAIVAWDERSDNDIAASEILRKPTPVGGRIVDAYSINLYTLITLLAVITVAVGFPVLLKKYKPPVLRF